ncbi:serine/threonine protein kinase [Agromyces sp. SYSU K20354]|uniref:serine/threonine-protein kinase n=1 Tax=Agromyces cavernae TaxID=2898659 RepID=UPI001E39A275|nr:serine/threonine-protein kinase [Agromyces cavernae]MCD2441117.1 serine/threonine protein kinase [Agromyces cavernae]
MTTTPEPATVDSFTGVVFGGRYRIDGLIGRGGMASVYRGTDTALGRSVAVKVFAEAAEGIDDAARRRSEVALLASVEHRALVRLYDAAHDDPTGREYLVMELVDGHDLRETLRSGPVGAADAAGLAADLGEALHVIHARGIVHRDVKPANVLLEPAHLPTRSWNAKLADFGIARLIDDARITRTGLLIGTPGFLSPEQVSGEAAGSATDVYALGLLLLEARTGRPAFPGSAGEAASARLVRDPDVPDAFGRGWVDLLRAMTARDPGARPTALEVAVAAAALDHGSSASASASAGAESASTAAVADAATVAVGAPDDGTAPTRRLTAPASAPVASAADDDPVATAQTRVMTARDVAPPVQPPPSRRPRKRRRAPVVATLVIVAAVAIAGALFLPGLIAAQNPEPAAPEPLPTLPAELNELGEHLRQLDEAVTP